MFDRVFIIAEAGTNHNGDLDTAVELVYRAGESGADAIKFQDYTLHTLFSPAHYERALNIKDHSWQETIEKTSFKPEWHGTILRAAEKKGIHYFSTPFSTEAVDMLDEFVPFYKVSSGDITHIPLLERIGRAGKGVFISTGASRMVEIEAAVHILEKYDLPFICIMHCIMLYPPPDKALHLNFIDTLRLRFDYPIGFSDHTLDTQASVMAVAKGVRVLEKHFTLDRNQRGSDHANSLDPAAFAGLVRIVRRSESMLGDWKRPIPEAEAGERVYARRGIYAGENLAAGESVSPDRMQFLRPNIGMGADELLKVKNRTLNTDIERGNPLELSMFD